VRCIFLQRVAVVLQCGAVCNSMFECVADGISVLQCVAVCCSVCFRQSLSNDAADVQPYKNSEKSALFPFYTLRGIGELQYVATCCNVLQCSTVIYTIIRIARCPLRMFQRCSCSVMCSFQHVSQV